MKRISRAAIWSMAACIAVWEFGTIAEAAIIGTATLVRNPPTVPFTAPESALGAPWVGYELSLQSTAGEIIAAVDVTINGQLHQRWSDIDFDTIPDPSPNSANVSQGDSHLSAIPGALFASGPVEDNPGTGSPLTSGSFLYGVGTYLRGAWGIRAASQTTSASLAYIVIPSGSLHLLDVRVRAANSAGDIIADLTESDFFDVFPGIQPLVNDLNRVTTQLNEVVNLKPIDAAPGTAPVTWSALAGPVYTPAFGAFPVRRGSAKRRRGIR